MGASAFSNGLNLLRRATGPADRVVAVGSGLIILLVGWQLATRAPGAEAVVYHNNRPLMNLPLDENRQWRVAGNLGPVLIEVAAQRVRLREYVSPRMIGTRSGWIGHTGEVVTCVPCGILIEIRGDGGGTGGKRQHHEFDGIAR